MVTQSLYVQLGRTRYVVGSVEDAAEKWCAFRDATYAGSSEIGNGVAVIQEDGTKVAQISYNGRIWTPGTKYFA